MTIFVGLTFSGPIPLLIPLCFLGLVTRYIFFKFSFIRFCKIPPTMDESMNDRVLQIMPVTIVTHLCFSIWAYGVKSVFAFEDSWMSDLVLIFTNLGWDFRL